LASNAIFLWSVSTPKNKWIGFSIWFNRQNYTIQSIFDRFLIGLLMEWFNASNWIRLWSGSRINRLNRLIRSGSSNLGQQHGLIILQLFLLFFFTPWFLYFVSHFYLSLINYTTILFFPSSSSSSSSLMFPCTLSQFLNFFSISHPPYFSSFCTSLNYCIHPCSFNTDQWDPFLSQFFPKYIHSPSLSSSFLTAFTLPSQNFTPASLYQLP